MKYLILGLILLLPLPCLAETNYFRDSMAAIELLNAEVEYLELALPDSDGELGNKDFVEAYKAAREGVVANLKALRSLLQKRVYMIQVRGNANPDDIEQLQNGEFRFDSGILDKADSEQSEPMTYALSDQGKAYSMTLPIKHIIKRLRANSKDDIETTVKGMDEMLEFFEKKPQLRAILKVERATLGYRPIHLYLRYFRHAFEVVTKVHAIFGGPSEFLTAEQKKPLQTQKKTSAEKMAIWAPSTPSKKGPTQGKKRQPKQNAAQRKTKNPEKNEPTTQSATVSELGEEAVVNTPANTNEIQISLVDPIIVPVKLVEEPEQEDDSTEIDAESEVLLEYGFDLAHHHSKKKHHGAKAKERELELLKNSDSQLDPDQKKVYLLDKDDFWTFQVLNGKVVGSATDKQLNGLIASLLQQSEGKADYMAHNKGQITVRINGQIFRYDPTHGRDAGRVYHKKSSHVVRRLAMAGISLDNVQLN